MKDSDLLRDAKEQFALCQAAELENRKEALDDLKFARLGEQWPEKIRAQRERENRPCLTINREPAFIRQVVNDGRQNKPSIKVRPVDDGADVQTAKVYDGLIRNIEYTSNADVAYDTASEFAVSMGFGYFRISVEHAYDDTFDKDLRIEPITNPFSVYGDPVSTAADSSDWNTGFITDLMPKARFEKRYKGAAKAGWDGDYTAQLGDWIKDDSILVAEWWNREEVVKTILALSDGSILDRKIYEEHKDLFDIRGVTVLNERQARGHKVTHRLMTGAEVLETTEWAGRYIPIIPVYGEVVNVEGKRYLRSLIRDTKDAQRNYNYWRSAATELVALAPKAPFIGPVGAFNTDADRWTTANTDTHAYLEYDGEVPPQRQPFAGMPAGALQEALNASDDMKSIMGMYDASLGARSNETSGRAIMARQREGDVSTFHFLDNLTRAIRHAGRVLIDLIPHVYDQERIIRVLGQDGAAQPVPVNQPVMMSGEEGAAPVPLPPEAVLPPNTTRADATKAQIPQQDGSLKEVEIIRFDLTRGKYDLAVEAGPSFTTRREEAATQMTELIRAFPAAAPVLGDLLAKNLDWPGADEIAERLKALAPQPGGQQGPDPAEQAKAQLEMQKLQGEAEARQMDMQIKQAELELKARELSIKEFEAQTDRLRTQTEHIQAMRPDPIQPPSGGFFNGDSPPQ